MRLDLSRELGDLTAALHALRFAQEGLSPDTKATAQQLESEVATIAHAVQQPQPDKTTLAQRLDQATSLLGKLTSITEAAQKLGPTFTLLGTVFDAMRRWVMGGVTGAVLLPSDARGTPAQAGGRASGRAFPTLVV